MVIFLKFVLSSPRPSSLVYFKPSPQHITLAMVTSSVELASYQSPILFYENKYVQELG